MVFFRLVFGLMLFGGLACFALYVGTHDLRWRRRGLLVLKWAVLAAFGFFAVLILERLDLLP